MDLLITIALFVVLLAVYMNVVEEYKRGEELEIYELDYEGVGNGLHEACKLKQPFLFEFRHVEPDVFMKLNLDEVGRDINNDFVEVYDTDDFYSSTGGGGGGTLISFPLRFASAVQLAVTDSKSHYVSEHNEVFVEETGLGRYMAVSLNKHFKPGGGGGGGPSAVVSGSAWMSSSKFDLLFGSKGAQTPCRYHTGSRYFLGVVSGRIAVRMSPWKSRKYLHPYDDYVHFDFLSASPLRANANLKYLEFVVKAGYVLYVPPYWWYEVEYLDKSTGAFACRYDTVCNAVAHADRWVRFYVEQQAVFKNFWRRRPVDMGVDDGNGDGGDGDGSGDGGGNDDGGGDGGDGGGGRTEVGDGSLASIL